MARTAETAAHSQTLSRGIRALEILADSRAPLTIAELAASLGLHRSIAYRIIRTLEDHSLVERDDSGRLLPGAGLAVLARGVARDLQSAASPELGRIADELGMTAFVVVWDHAECVTLATVEPRHNGATLAQRPGTRHSVSSGAPGIAIQSALGRAEWEQRMPGVPYRLEADEARERGYAVSHDEVIPGVFSVAVPIQPPRQRPSALAVVHLGGNMETEAIGKALATSARRIAEAIG
ncbi:helix-turn-helix domain-containing protein [Sinomonas sp. ASV322]|uniref:IclR family transcriptional regulator n=1 Tax=Sinomonas sp. ASV322 TaxID=3041920 RepID=UPI0027DE74A7|nr:helix-turn-helix domain-containing protein [Sinomonas sp. ASV322]MDQ4502098.1 helix-turn-helix domain-containing protein [Sinomonas sp. ASV322]